MRFSCLFFYLFLFSNAFGQDVETTKDEPVKSAVVLYMDEAPDVVRKHVAVVSGVGAENVKVSTLSAYLRGKAPTVSAGASVSQCSGAPSAMENIKDSIDRSRAAIDMMEDSKAIAYLMSAVGGIGCLGEPLNGEQASELYFLKGFLEHAGGDEAAARQSFRLVHQLQSDLSWDTYFSPEAEPLFLEVQESVLASESVNLRVVPAPKAGSVWLDGNPASMVGSQLPISSGVHFIQFVGEKVQTYEIVIDGTEDVEFVVPALLPTNDMSWVASLESSEGYSQVFETMQEQGSTLYVSFENSIWSSILGTREWNELVAQGAADQGEMLKQERHAKSPKLVGMVLASLGGVVVPVGVATLPSLIQALEDASDAQTTYDELDAKFRDHSVEGDGGVEIATYSNEVYIPSKKARTAAIIRSSVSITSGGITLGFGLIQLKIAKQRRAELPPWHPYSMDLMSEPADD